MRAVRTIVVVGAVSAACMNASAQIVFDRWVSNPVGQPGLLAEASVIVAARGESGGGRITLRCTESEGSSITISATEGVGRGSKPWRKVRLKFDSAPFFDKDWLHSADAAKASLPEYIAYFVRMGTKPKSLYANIQEPVGRSCRSTGFPDVRLHGSLEVVSSAMPPMNLKPLHGDR
jgi:hypothetical protein